MSTAPESLTEINARLQARVDELEAQLNEKPQDEVIATPDTIATARGIPQRAVDEITHVSRALLAAAIEQMRVSAEVLDTFANGASELRQPAEPISYQLASIPRSIVSGLVRAINHALDGPSRRIHSFCAAYDTPPPASTAKTPTA
jgi:cell division septum initiation protein DivIVA